MAKHDRRKRSSQPPRSQTVTIQVPLPVLGVLNGVRAAFHGLCIETGMQVLQAMMEGNREDLCGPKGRHRVERPAWRGGSVSSAVTLGGRQVACNVVKHKLRNVTGHLPERLHASVGKALRDAWDLDSADRAAWVLERLAGSLERDHSRRGGVHPGGPRGNADGAAAWSDGGARTYSALDQHHRKPDGQRRGLHAAGQAVAR